VDLDLTPAGRTLLERFAEIRNAELLRLLGEVPDEKLRQIAKVVDELSVHLLDVGGEGEERCLRCGVHFRSGCVVHDVLGRACTLSQELYGAGEEAVAS
jgi:hypothetical protein